MTRSEPQLGSMQLVAESLARTVVYQRPRCRPEVPGNVS